MFEYKCVYILATDEYIDEKIDAVFGQEKISSIYWANYIDNWIDRLYLFMPLYRHQGNSLPSKGARAPSKYPEHMAEKIMANYEESI